MPPQDGQTLLLAPTHNPSPVPNTLGSSPQHFVRPPGVRHIVSGHGESEVALLPLQELQFPVWKLRVVFTVTPASLALLYLVGGLGLPQ